MKLSTKIQLVHTTLVMAGAAGFGVAILVLEYTLGDGYGLHPGLGLAAVSLLTLLAVAAHGHISRDINKYTVDFAATNAVRDKAGAPPHLAGNRIMWPDDPDYERKIHVEPNEAYQNWLRDMVGDDEVEPTTERHAPAPSEWKLQTRNNIDTGEVYKVWIDQYGRRREVEKGDNNDQ